MKAEIVSVGTEIMLGEIVDTNAAYLASELAGLGIELLWVSQVADHLPRMLEVFSRAWQRSDITIITGGLGPTADDLTRLAIAEFLGEKLEVDATLEAELRQRFTLLKMEMPVSNLRQAMLIPSARSIRNAFGTAPGWWVEKDGRHIITLPGPPREMQAMWRDDVRHSLRQFSKDVIVTRTFKTFGLSEAAAGELVAPLFEATNPALGIYARPDGIHLRLAARAETEEAASALAAEMEASIRNRLGAHIWGTGDETLEAIVGRLLMDKEMTLGVMEDYTGGLLTTTITEAPESRLFLKGGFVANSEAAKVAAGVDKGVLEQCSEDSPEAARAMAEAARNFFSASIGVGIAKVKEGEIGPGTVVCMATTIGEFHRIGIRLGKRRVVTTTLFELRKLLL